MKCEICGKEIVYDEKNTGTGFNIELKNHAGETFYIGLGLKRIPAPKEYSDPSLYGMSHYDCLLRSVSDFWDFIRNGGTP